MHKRKDGKIVASLTEVKNKTGDIFSLVDEFGEVLLTSYNKPKYRIVKVDISETVNLQGENEAQAPKPKPVAPAKSSVIHKVKSTFTRTVKQEAPAPAPVVVEAEVGLLSSDVLQKLTSLKVWERNSKAERNFVSRAIKPLQ